MRCQKDPFPGAAGSGPALGSTPQLRQNVRSARLPTPQFRQTTRTAVSMGRSASRRALAAEAEIRRREPGEKQARRQSSTIMSDPSTTPKPLAKRSLNESSR